MTNLIATLEGLTSPSREVDCEIAWQTGWDADAVNYCGTWRRAYPSWRGDEQRIEAAAYNWGVPTFTASLDAITALVERVLPGWSYEVRKSGFGNGQAALWNPTMQPRPGLSIRADHASSPAIALCIALLRAKEARP